MMNDLNFLGKDLDFFLFGLDTVQAEVVLPDCSSWTFPAYFDQPNEVFGLVGKMHGNSSSSDFDLQMEDCRLTCKSVDAVGIPRGASIVIGEMAFTVERVLPDGTGISSILLSDGSVSVYE
ncbi:head-tail joining protein [Desulfobaculum bizertense]|nr:hypothetical protein [Desulfobaculum bizertense]UIJ38517.1 hypothetical protein LWC08_02820 [Desulfobaculum bizertense]UIJ38968.1 hypothetical protein LWC08_05180 [Desulfobaculum bizertense]